MGGVLSRPVNHPVSRRFVDQLRFSENCLALKRRPGEPPPGGGGPNAPFTYLREALSGSKLEG